MIGLLALLLLAAGAPPPPAPIVRLSSPAFGGQAAIELRDLPVAAAEQAMGEAFREIEAGERAADPERSEGGIAALNAAAGRGPQSVAPRLMNLLTRALDFCVWSERAHGPLARDLYRSWGLRLPVAALPTDEKLAPAIAATACDHLHLDAKKATATLDAGSALDLWGFAQGEAIDRAVEVLKQQGAGNGLVQIGGVRRGFGAGPDGRGWRVSLPAFAGMDHSAGDLWLRDQSVAVASCAERPLRIAGEVLCPYLNQRRGRPAEGVIAVVTATQLAVDAEALAATLLITGSREGQLRLGALRPVPSVLWVLGSGAGAPLLFEYRWSAVPKK